MSQHDFSIANQGFPSFRADLNSGLEALATNSSGATAPTTTYAYQFWYDTANDLLKMRNGDNDAWITLAAFDQANDEWEIRSAVIQAVDAAGVEIKTDDGTTRLDIADDGTVTVPGDLTVSGTLTATLDSNIIQEGNSSVEVIDSGTGSIRFTTDGTEAARFDNNGRLGIGTASPDASINIASGDPEIRIQRLNNSNTSLLKFFGAGGGEGASIEHTANTDDISFRVRGTRYARIITGGDFQFDSGFGSTKTAYGCRAWVNFNGEGTVSIRDSGNVSSIADNGTGQYEVNFATAMPDANFSAVFTCRDEVGTGGRLLIDEATGDEQGLDGRLTSMLPVLVFRPSDSVLQDSGLISVAVFR